MSTCKMDLRPGGTFLYCLQTPDGGKMWGKFVYREIAPPERIVFINSFSDENAGVTRHPLSPTWPLELLSTITFTAHGAKTTVTVRWTTLNPTEVEAKTFKDGHDSMRQGWTGTLDQLGDYLAKVRAEPSTNALGRRRLTLPSSGQPPACRWLPLMPIVRRLVICNVLGYTHRGDPRV
jgi:uncharacterized protein YndB with AHSA1/START domain